MSVLCEPAEAFLAFVSVKMASFPSISIWDIFTNFSDFVLLPLDLSFLICKVQLMMMITGNTEYFLCARHCAKSRQFSYYSCFLERKLRRKLKLFAKGHELISRDGT